MNESDFDKLVSYTLRVELINGKVLFYRIDTNNKIFLINNLRERSDGDDSSDKKLAFLETFFGKILLMKTWMKKVNIDYIHN
ncbi:hypothetical protein SAMN06265350_103226 [Solitalea koreensis]|uniref:Uncharacterized protein n=1 Tax=Solitalea koreensis TaxID=543615 RepID=A0A521C5L0_9SPHI|nr:hypothetical protein SAMN06265350_103226 [Solitalea koreensis]